MANTGAGKAVTKTREVKKKARVAEEAEELPKPVSHPSHGQVLLQNFCLLILHGRLDSLYLHILHRMFCK